MVINEYSITLTMVTNEKEIKGMHPVQDHINTLEIDYLVHISTDFFSMVTCASRQSNNLE